MVLKIGEPTRAVVREGHVTMAAWPDSYTSLLALKTEDRAPSQRLGVTSGGWERHGEGLTRRASRTEGSADTLTSDAAGLLTYRAVRHEIRVAVTTTFAVI